MNVGRASRVVSVPGVTTSFAWHQVWPAPQALPVREVQAWIVDEAGRALLLEMPGGWDLPGGTPEQHDADWLATLHRELRAGADVTVGDVIPLGYQEVRPSGAEPYARLRAVARVEVWHEQTPDPDHGLVHPRVWVPLDQAAVLLNWGEPGRAQAVAAAQAACDAYGFDAAGLLAQGAAHPDPPVVQVV
jgi:8-oxo-dGTP diphosphatase